MREEREWKREEGVEGREETKKVKEEAGGAWKRKGEREKKVKQEESG